MKGIMNGTLLRLCKMDSTNASISSKTSNDWGALAKDLPSHTMSVSFYDPYRGMWEYYYNRKGKYYFRRGIDVLTIETDSDIFSSIKYGSMGDLGISSEPLTDGDTAKFSFKRFNSKQKE